MARYILIDNCSGYIWGDTGDLNGAARDETPIEAAARLDASLMGGLRTYEETSRHDLASNETGYHVYRADVGGSEAVPLVSNGQDEDTIEACLLRCKYVTTLRTSDAEE